MTLYCRLITHVLCLSCAGIEASIGQSPKQVPIDKPKSRLAMQVLERKNVICIEPGSPNIFLLPTTKTMENEHSQVAKYDVDIVDVSDPSTPRKVLMVVGATGAGKTTLINGIANYILGVQWTDNFRFKLIADEGQKSQAESQTKWITAYTFHKMEGSAAPYTLTIIDTPGFGDTEGLERDKLLVRQIKEFFSVTGDQGIDELHGIGFVTQASLARLTQTQKYIFQSILSIFGKNIAKNIFMMITFADAVRPPVLGAVKKAKVPFRKHFKFNNSALFTSIDGGDDDRKDDEDNDDTGDEASGNDSDSNSGSDDGDEADEDDSAFNRMFWKMGFKSFQRFFTQFQKVKGQSLQLTREVLEERQRLETVIEGLQPQIRAGLSKINTLRKERDLLKKHEAAIEANQNFTDTIMEPAFIREDLRGKSEYTTTCLTCNYTCHYSCIYSNDKDKIHCAAMSNGYCQNCPNKCFWEKHSNTQYRIRVTEKPKVVTYEDLKRRYYDAKTGKSAKESILSGLRADLATMRALVLGMIGTAHLSLKKLEKIALRPNPLTEVDYIKLLIQSEQQEAKPGWEQRVECLKRFQEEAELMNFVKESYTTEQAKHMAEVTAPGNAGDQRENLTAEEAEEAENWWETLIEKDDKNDEDENSETSEKFPQGAVESKPKGGLKQFLKKNAAKLVNLVWSPQEPQEAPVPV